MGFQGKTIPDCCCSFCELEEVNAGTVFPLLKKVVETPFFSHFKIDLCTECELWQDAPLCRMKDCGVCECEEPPEWSFENVHESPPTGPDPTCGDDGLVFVVAAADDDYENVVDGWSLVGKTKTTTGGGGAGFSFSWMEEEEDDDDNDDSNNSGGGARVVDLLKNPEKYTGYTGPSAEKVWSAIHERNCFQKPAKRKRQQPRFNRVIDRNRHGKRWSPSAKKDARWSRVQ